MKIMKRIWVVIGKHYHKKRNWDQALHYLRRGESAITRFEDKIQYANLLHHNGHSEQALTYLDGVIETSGSSRAYELRAHVLRELNRNEEALQDLNQALGLNKDHYLTWYTRGITNRDLGHYDEAIRDLKESIKREDASTVTSTYYELGMAYYDSGNPAEAVNCLRQSVVRPDRAVPLYYYRLAVSLGLTGQVQEAIEVLLEGIRLADRYAAADDGGYALFASSSNYSLDAFESFQQEMEEAQFFRPAMAELYVQLENWEQAEKYITEAIVMYPEDHELYLKRAAIRAKAGWRAKAEADLEHVIQAAPADYRGYFELARMYRAEDQEDRAFELIRKLYDRLPEHPLVCYWMADGYYRLGRNEEALAMNNKLLELEDDDAPNYVQRANIGIELYDLPLAEAALRQALELQDDAEFHNKLSYVLYLQGRNEEALIELQEAARLDEDFADHPTFLTGSGHIYKEMKLWDLAIDAYSRAIEIVPGSPKFYEFRAVCFIETGQLERALADCSQGLELDPEFGSLYSLRSGVYYSMLDYARAREDTMKFLSLAPGHPGAYFRLGQILYKDNEEEEALNAFNQVLEIIPDHAETYLYKAYIYYHQFEMEDAVQAIVNWSLHLDKEMPPAQKVEAIEALEGFEEDILSRAVERLTGMYGQQLYLS
ncbi:tetratricopeptide repeat protein [Paenibacillus sp. FSL M8-0334]|uniref:tetratricopeptide repeat protein n=1 Tax=Paenibacillus sp. FSL M8-0334 TaxID=2921623 RepID=UPI0030FA8770